MCCDPKHIARYFFQLDRAYVSHFREILMRFWEKMLFGFQFLWMLYKILKSAQEKNTYVKFSDVKKAFLVLHHKIFSTYLKSEI